jgi:tRNA (guanine10-N2)-methyltransferase
MMLFLQMHFLFWCAAGTDDREFRIPEFESLSELLKIPLRWIYKSSSHPWIILDLDSPADAQKFLSRSISSKYCIQLWAEGSSYSEFHASLRAVPFNEDTHQCYLDKEKSYKIDLESFGKTISHQERLVRIDQFEYVPFEGRVSLTNPDVTFALIEFWGLDHNNLPDEPLSIFFGPVIGEGQRHLLTRFSIKSRKFIGNTTMDPQLAFLMANLGLVDSGKLVLDPFVGTGSLLLAAAQFGGLVCGGDIDFLTLHARSRPSRVGQKIRYR